MSIQSRKRVSTYDIESCVQIGHYRKRANEIASFVQTQYMKASHQKLHQSVCFRQKGQSNDWFVEKSDKRYCVLSYHFACFQDNDDDMRYDKQR